MRTLGGTVASPPRRRRTRGGAGRERVLDRAHSYARVIEIPTRHRTAHDARYFGVQMPPEAPMTTTERAYTSPILFTPSN